MNTLYLYLYLTAHNLLGNVFFMLLVVFVGLTLVAWISYMDRQDETLGWAGKNLKRAFVGACIIAIIGSFVPGKKDALMLFGVHKLENTSIPEKTVKLIERKLEEL